MIEIDILNLSFHKLASLLNWKIITFWINCKINKGICLLLTKTLNNQSIMRKWFNEVMRKYFHFKYIKKKMLVMDAALKHKIDIIKNKIKEC